MTKPEPTPFDNLPEEQKQRLWDVYMDWEKSALVESILEGMTQAELEAELKLFDELESEDQ